MVSVCFLLISGQASAQAPARDTLQTCTNCYADTTKATGYLYHEKGRFVYSPRTFHGVLWALVFLPTGLFVLVLFFVLALLRRTNFSIAEALSENYTITVDVPNPNAAAGGGPYVPQSVTPKSVSRLIAFLSGLAALILSVTATSYYFYIYLKTGVSPNLANLFNIILSLGVGVVPYAFNRVAAAFSGTN